MTLGVFGWAGGFPPLGGLSGSSEFGVLDCVAWLVGGHNVDALWVEG